MDTSPLIDAGLRKYGQEMESVTAATRAKHHLTSDMHGTSDCC